MSRMIGIGLVAALAACSGKTNNNGGQACQVTADCAADQTCEDGVCVDLGGDACTVTADCPAAETCEAGVCTPAPLPDLEITFIDSVIRDERGDQVDLSGDAPKHTHAGEPITLNGEGCPEVHKYAYLTDPDAPLFGTEDIANPIAWRFNVDGAAVIARADYRIRTATTTLLDWTETTADLAGTFPVEVFRSGAHPVPELGAIAQQYFIDFRVRDDRDREATVTGCWDHHPIAAPVRFIGLLGSADADSLKNMTLLGNSPISRVLTGSTGVKAFAARVINPTAERVVVDLTLPIPTGTYSKLGVVDLVSQKTLNSSVFCGTTCPPNSTTCVPETVDEPRCKVTTPSDPADSIETGAVEPGAWVARVIDVRTGNPAAACTVAGLHASCVLLPREAGLPAPELVVELATSEHRELAPSAFGTLGEFSLLGLTYTGKPIDQTENKFRCDTSVNVANQDGGTDHICREFTTFFKLTALDSLRVTFNAPTMSVKTSTPPQGTLPQGELAPPADRPSGQVTGTGFTWDAGNDDLPGSAH